MKPTCGHWRDCGFSAVGGCCDDPEISRQHPRPSYGACNGCEKNPGRGRPMPAVVQVRVPTSEERAAAAKIEAERIEKYHEIWRAIHATALTGELTEAKLLSILKELPAGTCSCLGNFTAICKADPLPADAGRQFAWSVRVHNAVNRSLGKPELSEEAAWAIYRPEA